MAIIEVLMSAAASVFFFLLGFFCVCVRVCDVFIACYAMPAMLCYAST